MGEGYNEAFANWWEDRFGGNITAESWYNGKWTYEPMQNMYEAWLACEEYMEKRYV